MVGVEMKVGPVFTWADEVEKEEEEEARIGVCAREKPNPFGSARPREVVLQEKGIDWRKLDQGLHQSSNTRYGTPVEKPLKENNPAYSSRGGNNKQISSARNLQSKPENRERGLNGREVSRGFVTPDKQMGGIYAGPLRYQTRNALASLSVETYHNSRRLSGEEKKNTQYRNDFDFLYENRHEGEREPMFHEPQTRKFYDFIGLGIEGHTYRRHDQFGPHNSLVGWEREYTEFYTSGRRYGMEERGRPQIEVVPDAERRFLNHCSERWPLGDGRTEALLIPEKRPSYLDDQARNAGVGRRLMSPSYRGAAEQRQWQQRPWQQKNSGSRMVNPARSKMYLDKNKNKTANSLEEVSVRQRANVQCNVMNGADSAGNYRKRRMKSGPESYPQHWKRI